MPHPVFCLYAKLSQQLPQPHNIPIPLTFRSQGIFIMHKIIG